jgi:hypothetical protein
MTTKIGRPVEFGDSKRETFCTLVGVGVSRRHAAASVGVSPSTVSRHMAADSAFADKVLQAEAECEVDLMRRVRTQSERSWRAAVWLLERMRPERYARGKIREAGPSFDSMFNTFVAIVEAEIADASLRERVFARLDEMAQEELAAQSLDHSPPATPAVRTPHDQHAPASLPPAKVQVQKSADLGQATLRGEKPSAGDAPAQRRLEAMLGALGGTNGPQLDFCNTSPDHHERRSLEKVGS